LIFREHFGGERFASAPEEHEFKRFRIFPNISTLGNTHQENVNSTGAMAAFLAQQLT
jgi:hypothetical protein